MGRQVHASWTASFIDPPLVGRCLDLVRIKGHGLIIQLLGLLQAALVGPDARKLIN
jgi:hypothetical protein